MKNLTNWLNANETCVNISKTELVLFKLSRKLTDVLLKLKLNRRFFDSVKHLGIKICESLNWKQENYDIAIKLSRTNAVLSKSRHFIDRKTLKYL